MIDAAGLIAATDIALTDVTVMQQEIEVSLQVDEPVVKPVPVDQPIEQGMVP